MQAAAVEHPSTINVPVGQYKSFGANGPAYKVGAKIRRLEDGDWMVAITVVATGEAAEYRLSRMAADPEVG